MTPDERAEARRLGQLIKSGCDYDACTHAICRLVAHTLLTIDALDAVERERDEAREQHRKASALAHSYWLELALIKNHGSDDAKVLKARAKAALEET